jgi:hypothetical protein
MSAIDPFSSARKQDPQMATRQIKGGTPGGTSSKEKPKPSGTSNASPPGSSEERKLCRYSTSIRTHTGHKAKAKGENTWTSFIFL